MSRRLRKVSELFVQRIELVDGNDDEASRISDGVLGVLLPFHDSLLLFEEVVHEAHHRELQAFRYLLGDVLLYFPTGVQDEFQPCPLSGKLVHRLLVGLLILPKFQSEGDLVGPSSLFLTFIIRTVNEIEVGTVLVVGFLQLLLTGQEQTVVHATVVAVGAVHGEQLVKQLRVEASASARHVGDEQLVDLARSVPAERGHEVEVNLVVSKVERHVVLQHIRGEMQVDILPFVLAEEAHGKELRKVLVHPSAIDGVGDVHRLPLHVDKRLLEERNVLWARLQQFERHLDVLHARWRHLGRKDELPVVRFLANALQDVLLLELQDTEQDDLLIPCVIIMRQTLNTEFID